MYISIKVRVNTSFDSRHTTWLEYSLRVTLVATYCGRVGWMFRIQRPNSEVERFMRLDIHEFMPEDCSWNYPYTGIHPFIVSVVKINLMRKNSYFPHDCCNIHNEWTFCTCLNKQYASPYAHYWYHYYTVLHGRFLSFLFLGLAFLTFFFQFVSGLFFLASSSNISILYCYYNNQENVFSSIVSKYVRMYVNILYICTCVLYRKRHV